MVVVGAFREIFWMPIYPLWSIATPRFGSRKLGYAFISPSRTAQTRT
jgi:hypothetical protein